jgi:tetratricopeptide (TPR) repeat protein
MLLTLATLLGLLASTLLAADAEPQSTPPRLLPPDAVAASKPMPVPTEERSTDTLWQAIEDHQAGRWEDAIAAWQRVDLPCETEAWRWVGQGVAHLYLGQLDDAADSLTLANQHDSQNAVVHYFAGLLRLEQAEAAREYADALHFDGVRVVSHAPGPHRHLAYDGKPKSRYELEAINEFESAIEYASAIDLAAPLVPVRWVATVPYPMTELLAPPTVENLLRALDAENFVGKAHGLLAQLYLDRKSPQEAEHHVEQAGAHGILVPYGFRLVGELYEAQGRSTDAYRAYRKAMQSGDTMAAPRAEAVRDLEDAFEELF